MAEWTFLHKNVVSLTEKEKADLKVVLQEYDETGESAKCGIWSINSGAYDRWWELCKHGEPVVCCLASGEYDNGVEIGNLERLSDISFKERDDIFKVIVSEYSDVRCSPNEPDSPEEFLANEAYLIQETVEAGDWHINEDTFKLFKNATAPFNDEQLLSKDLGCVYFGNHSFGINIVDSYFEDPTTPSVTLVIHQRIPLFQYEMSHDNGQIEKRDFQLINYKNVLYRGDLTKALYCNHGKVVYLENCEEALSSLEDFKRVVSEKLILDECINPYWNEEYKKFTEQKNGYFHQLDKQLYEYPSIVAQKENMSILDLDTLRHYYTSDGDRPWTLDVNAKWDAKTIVSHMIASGFKNEDISELCYHINKFAIEANHPLQKIDENLYSDFQLKKIRKQIKQKKKDLER